MAQHTTHRHGGERRTRRGEKGHAPAHTEVRTPHLTALVVIPPEDVWAPIQAIRAVHDRKFRRWMPHINLVYPFRPRADFDLLSADLVHACEHSAPCQVTLAEFRAFRHEGEHYTLWLAPDAVDELDRLHYLLWRVAPECDEVRRYEGGFRPHLSVGQVTGRQETERLLAELQAGWQPLRFTVSRVSLIYREAPPDDVFRVDRTIPLGGVAAHPHPELMDKVVHPRRH